MSDQTISRIRDKRVFRSRMAGETLRQIGQEHGLSAPGVRLVFAKEARRQIDDLELALLVGSKTGEWPLFVVPFQSQADWRTALDYFSWAVQQLRDRGVALSVITRQVAGEGTVFMLTTDEEHQ